MRLCDLPTRLVLFDEPITPAPSPEEIREMRAPDRQAYYEANKGRIKANARRYYAENREAVRIAQKQWREENREYVAERKRKWQQENKDKVAENQRRYRLRKAA